MDVLSKRYAGPERRVASAPFEGRERRGEVVGFDAAAPTARGTDSRAKLFGHPVHQQLVAFPVGLLTTAVLFDLAYIVGGWSTMATVASWMIVAGLVAAALAVPFGVVDWLNIPEGTRAKRIGIFHGMGNVCVMLLFLLSALMRINDMSQPLPLALGFSILGGVLAIVSGWLGGELVSRLGIGVSSQAGPDAPNSMRKP